MPVPRHTHSFVIGSTDFTGFAEPYSPRPDETLPEEALTVKSYWLLLVDGLSGALVQDAQVTDVSVLNGSLIESGPLYIRQVKPFLSGLATDHVELRAVAYREES